MWLRCKGNRSKSERSAAEQDRESTAGGQRECRGDATGDQRNGAGGRDTVFHDGEVANSIACVEG